MEANKLIIPVPTESGVNLNAWENAPPEYAVPMYDYSGDRVDYTWFLHSVGALGESVPWYDGQYHAVLDSSSNFQYAHGTIVDGLPEDTREGIDIQAVVLSVAPDLAEILGDDYLYSELPRCPATFLGFGEPQPSPRFWTNLIRTNEII